MELGWTQKTSMPARTFKFGIASDSEEINIFVIGGRQPSGVYSNLISKYDSELDAWSTSAAQLALGGKVATSKSLNGIVWLLLTVPSTLVDRFNTDTETLDGLNILNVPTCKLGKIIYFLAISYFRFQCMSRVSIR